MSTRQAKMRKKLPPTFLDDLTKMDRAAIGAAIVSAEKEMSTLDETEDADEKLKAAKELLRDYSGPYREERSRIKAKLSYLALTLKERELMDGVGPVAPSGS
jgi:hypothetical protein